ncbi:MULTISPECIES: sulfotransferase domain-containing protein [unclassified Nocardioides]|uniref:sulfotransferase domain-containing protein n=1 Tax=unclassified Nocardioides TaxID=2615069 RepID=UPI0036230649
MNAPRLHPNAVQNRRLRRLAALEKAPLRVPVNFSIVGVQKAATSTVYMMLAAHKNIARGPEKEMRLFMMEQVDWADPDYSDYVRPARSEQQTMAGDATPEYLFWPRGLERMQRYNPDLPLIATFRDPIERALSQWSMQRSRDTDFPDVPETIELWADPRIPDEIPDGVSPYELRRRSLYTRGLYGQQLERGLAHFPREQWLLLDLKEIATDPEGVLDRVTDHLSLPRFEKYPERLHRNQTPTSNEGAAPSVEHVQRLVDVYAPDLARFAELSGLDISGWSTVKVIDGKMSVAELRDKLVGKLGLRG